MSDEIAGRKVKRIVWNGANGDESIEANDSVTMAIVNKYHGDHDDDWVIIKTGGKEIARHNVRYIASIQWAEPLPDAPA